MDVAFPPGRHGWLCAVIWARDLTKSYATKTSGDVLAVDCIDLEVGPGESLGILGELSGDACETRFLNKVAACLPSAVRRGVPLETALQQLFSL